MLYCEKVNCLYFDTYKDWQLMPDGDEMSYQAMWCEKQGRDLGLLDCEWLFSHECPLASSQNAFVGGEIMTESAIIDTEDKKVK